MGLAVLLVSLVLAITVGPAGIAPADVWAKVAHHLGVAAPGGDLSLLLGGIVWELRLPRVLAAALVGAGRAVAGAVMQTVVRDPLADPYLLGLSGGASLGAVAVPVLGVAVLLPVAVFVGALASLVATLALAGPRRRAHRRGRHGGRSPA